MEGYGSSEGGAAIQRTPGAPAGAIGRAAPATTSRWSTRSTSRCRRRLAEDGRLADGDEAIGELVNRGPNPSRGIGATPPPTPTAGADADWTGDLFYRDTDGFLYFAGRADDRLRVDSKNLAAAMIENILARHENAAAVAVYAVPTRWPGTR